MKTGMETLIKLLEMLLTIKNTLKQLLIIMILSSPYIQSCMKYTMTFIKK
jgi:hypothetical protein